jgi:hypothetical protein
MRSPPLLVIILLLLLAGAIGAGRWHSLRQREEIARQRAAVAQLSGQVQTEREQLQTLQSTAVTEERAAAARRAEAAREGSPAHLWSSRVQILQQLLQELPAQRLPEHALLEPLDWIEVAQDSELDTPNGIRDVLATLRAKARQKFVPLLQEALRRFTASSGGELPTKIQDLSSFLSPPATMEMLERYGLKRSGRLGATDETLIVERADSDMILSVSLSSWNMTNGSKPLPAPGETEMDALKRTAAAMGNAIGPEGAEMMQQFTRGLNALMEKIGPQMEAALGDKFDVNLKQAIATFRTARPGEAPATFADLLPFLANADQLVAVFRPMFAQIEYMRQHQGMPPSDEAQLRPYLARPFNPQEAFRAMKLELSADGEHGSMSFSLGGEK